MKKDLLSLTIREFTRVLLEYEEVYTLSINIHSISEGHKVIEKQGTYSQLYKMFVYYPVVIKQLKESFFDYNILISKIDIYDYLQYKTDNFDSNKIIIILDEMDTLYFMEYLEDINDEVSNLYIHNNWSIPYLPAIERQINNSHYIREANTIMDYKEMRNQVYPYREQNFNTAIEILRSKLKGTNTKSVLNISPKLKTVLIKAEKSGLLISNKNQYKWLKTKSLLAYFISKISDELELSPSNGRIQWKYFKPLFGYDSKDNSLAGALNDFKKVGTFPLGYEIIDNLFK